MEGKGEGWRGGVEGGMMDGEIRKTKMKTQNEQCLS